MPFSKIKDLKRRKQLFVNEHKLKSEKFIFINLVTKYSNLNDVNVFTFTSLLKSLYKKKKIKHRLSNKIKIVRRCLVNNRPRSVPRSFSISRSIFRELLQFGIIPGYKKAVW